MRPALLLLLLPSLALAQTRELLRPNDPTRGVTLPPTSLALVDEAPALSLNPAALSFAGGPQLFYLHERNLVRDSTADGLFTSSGLGPLGLGVGLEWMRPQASPDYRRTTWGLSLGGPYAALGAAYHNYSSDDAQVDRLSTWDFALATRPARRLSVAAVVLDVDAPGLPHRWG